MYGDVLNPVPHDHPPNGALVNGHHLLPKLDIPQPCRPSPPPPAAPPPANPQPHLHPPPPATKNAVIVHGIPSMTLIGGRMLVGNSQSNSARAYTPLKVVGDGSFGTVWLCDWHSPLPPGTPLSPMQCGAGARPEWAGKRLVALKRMKKRWDGGWDDCRKLKELESLRTIPPHENIIPLYDYFLLPSTKELYFVFESMEGNLYQLIKSRKGRPLAGGLVASVFRQVVHGLHHIHCSGYFHRDMKPENLLVTTTGLADYQPTSPLARPGAPPEKDVMVIVKIADFGLARETHSKPPYTEYVATRWYRAPEVLLRSKDYSNPVDLWALGTILAELINLKPLFPGQGEIDQVQRICEVLGDPTDEYGLDERGRIRGGGKWARGLRMARAVGFTFPRAAPLSFPALFAPSVPPTLVQLIEDLLRYDPEARLTTAQCLQHPYLRDAAARTVVPTTPPHPPPPSASSATSLRLVSPRVLPPSHAHLSPGQPLAPFNGADPQTLVYAHADGGAASVHPLVPHIHVDAEMVDALRPAPVSVELLNRLRELEEYPASPVPSSVYTHGGDRVEADSASAMAVDEPAGAADPPPKPGLMGFIGKRNKAWGFFGGHAGPDKGGVLGTVDELGIASTPSLKRTQSGGGSTSADSLSLQEPLPAPAPLPAPVALDPKKLKKEAERAAREAEKARRAIAEARHREQARAVMMKRNQLILQNTQGAVDFDWRTSNLQHNTAAPPALASSKSMASISAASTVRDGAVTQRYSDDGVQHRTKARRRECDDDHSSSDVHSIAHTANMSMISFATVNSDSGPSSPRKRLPGGPESTLVGSSANSHYTLDRGTSVSSLRSSAGFSSAASIDARVRSSASASVSSRAPSPPPLSPPPIHGLSLASWDAGCSPHPHHFAGRLPPAINPMFLVSDPPPPGTPALPPFAQLVSVAEHAAHPRPCTPLAAS